MIRICSQDGLIKEQWPGNQRLILVLVLSSYWLLTRSCLTLWAHASCVLPGDNYACSATCWGCEGHMKSGTGKSFETANCHTMWDIIQMQCFKKKPSVLASFQRKAHRLGFCTFLPASYLIVWFSDMVHKDTISKSYLKSQFIKSGQLWLIDIQHRAMLKDLNPFPELNITQTWSL